MVTWVTTPVVSHLTVQQEVCQEVRYQELEGIRNASVEQMIRFGTEQMDMAIQADAAACSARHDFSTPHVV